jgi:hypothetical protein
MRLSIALASEDSRKEVRKQTTSSQDLFNVKHETFWGNAAWQELADEEDWGD